MHDAATPRAPMIGPPGGYCKLPGFLNGQCLCDGRAADPPRAGDHQRQP
jgi:hypothetical protein